MIIDLNQQMADQLLRVTTLADEALQNDEEGGFQSRAAAMSACSTMLAQLTKAQESLKTLKNLTATEEWLVETLKEYLTEEQIAELLNKLEKSIPQL